MTRLKLKLSKKGILGLLVLVLLIGSIFLFFTRSVSVNANYKITEKDKIDIQAFVEQTKKRSDSYYELILEKHNLIKKINSTKSVKEKYILIGKYYSIDYYDSGFLDEIFGYIIKTNISKLQILNNEYWEDNNNVYYIGYMQFGEIFDYEQEKWHILKGVDVRTFLVKNNLGNIKEKTSVYNGNLSFEGTEVYVEYASDKNDIYINGIKVEGIDNKTYEIMPFGVFAKDKNNIYFRNWYDNFAPNIKLYGVDVNSFEIIDWNFAKDKNYVYLVTNCGGGSGRETCIDRISDNPKNFDPKKQNTETCPIDMDCNYKETSCDEKFYKQPKNTIDIHNGYYLETKNKKIYYGNTLISSDYGSFQTITDLDKDGFGTFYPGFAKDKNNVYFYGKKINGSDPKTFEIVNGNLAKDKSNIYYIGFCDKINTIIGADIKSFSTFSGEETYYTPAYYKDKNSVYWNGRKISGSDPKSFQILKYGYSKDKKNIYFESKRLQNVDLRTFQIIGGIGWYDAFDKKNIYREGETIKQ